MSEPFCLRIIERLGDKYGLDAESVSYPHHPDDCVIDVGPAAFVFSREKNGIKLHKSDIPVGETDLPPIKALLAKMAGSCKLEDVHEHAFNLGRGMEGKRYDVHLAGCTIDEVGKVLVEAGYGMAYPVRPIP